MKNHIEYLFIYFSSNIHLFFMDNNTIASLDLHLVINYKHATKLALSWIQLDLQRSSVPVFPTAMELLPISTIYDRSRSNGKGRRNNESGERGDRCASKLRESRVHL